jgi:hypothetical protein
MAEKVYPTVYIFENSVRDLIARVLKAEFGPTSRTAVVPGILQATASKHKADEKKDFDRAASGYESGTPRGRSASRH